MAASSPVCSPVSAPISSPSLSEVRFVLPVFSEVPNVVSMIPEVSDIVGPVIPEVSDSIVGPVFPEVVSVFPEVPEIIPLVVVDDAGADVVVDGGMVLPEKNPTNVGCSIYLKLSLDPHPMVGGRNGML